MVTQFFKKYDLNSASKIYLTIMCAIIVTLFLIISVTLVYLVPSKLEIIMNQNSEITCTYFISILDRILAVFLVLGILPITVFQTITKNKNKFDKFIAFFAWLILFVFTLIFLGGELHFYKMYSSGKLSSSAMFLNPTVETLVFDKFLEK